MGRTEQLAACLESLVLCGFDDFEVLVVDQNPDDRIVSTLKHFEPHLKLTYLRQQQPNASAARNLGAHAACGMWIGFPDDDCQFLPSTLRNLRERAGQGDADLLVLKSVQFQGGPSGVLGYDREIPIDNTTLRHTIAEYAIYLLRELFLSVDGFDPAFGPGGLFPADEGVDLIRRLWLRHPRALRMTYCPEVQIAHPQNLPYDSRNALNKAFRYAQGRGACFARHWKTASKRRALMLVAKAIASPVLFRGYRRWLGPVNLIGCLRGFFRYHFQAAHPASRPEGNHRSNRDNPQINAPRQIP
jgi:glycosyltransferase involved in cell wall biosynthesis